MSEIKTRLTLQDNFTNHLKNLHSNMKNVLSQFGMLDKAASKMGQVFGKMGQFASKMAGKFKQPFIQLGQAITNIRGKSRVLDGLMRTFGNLGNRVKSTLTGVISHVRNFASKLPGAFKQASNAVKQFGNDFKNAFNRMKSSAQQGGSVFKSVLGATGLVSIASNAIGQIQALSGAAMQSSDSMDKFASTMQFAGIDNKQISEATKQLKAYADLTVYDNADAFNTAAQLAANGISNYVDMTKAAGNLNAVAGGTKDTFKSLNLALVQTVGAGKLTTENWNQIADAIPGASGKLQQAMRDAGAFTGDFREAMADGEITANEFTDAILKLGNTQSALEAAQSTKTFEGAFGALESNVIDNINKVVNAIGKDKLVGIVNGTSELVSKATDKLLEFGNKLKPYADIVMNSFSRLKAPIQSAVQAVLASLGKLNGGLGSQKSLASFQSFVDGVVNNITKLAQFVEKNADSIAKFISMLPKLAAAFVGFKIGKGVVGNLFNFSSGILGMVGATGKLLFNLGGIIKIGKKKVPMPELPKSPINDMPGLPKGGKGKGFGVSQLFGTLDEYGKRAAGFASAFATIKLISEASKALKDVYENIPDDFAGLAVKFGTMGIALGAMGGLVAIAGKIANGNKSAAIAGFASIASISLMLMLAAESMKQINAKVPSNIGKFASKIANMSIAIGAFALLTGALGALTSTGIGTFVAGAGFVSIILLCAEMILVANAIKELNDKIPSNFGDIKKKLTTMSKVVAYFNDTSFGSAFNIVGNIINTANVAIITKTIGHFVAISKQLAKLNSISVPTDIQSKIEQIQEGIVPLTGSSLGNVFSSKFEQWETGNVEKTVSSLVSIAKKLKKLGEVKVPEGVDTVVSDIREAVSSLNDTSLSQAFSSKFEQWNAGNINSSLSSLISISKKLKSIQKVNIEPESIQKKIESIKEAIEPLSGGFWESLGQMFSNKAGSGNFSAANNAINNLIGIANNLVSLQYIPFNEQGASEKIDALKRVVEHLKGGTKGLGKAAEGYSNALQSIQKLQEVANTANQLVGMTIDTEAIIANINKVKEIISAMNGISQGTDGGAGLTATVQAFQNLIEVINQLNGTTQAVMGSFVGHIQNGMSQSVALINAGKDQMVQAFNGLSGQLQSAGIFAMQGLTSGIQSGAASAIAAAQSVANQISSTISSALKINSPSRVMMEIGGFVTEGLAIGLNRELAMVQRASSNLAMASMPNGLASMDSRGQINYNKDNRLSNMQMNQMSTNQGVVQATNTTTTISPTINVTVNGKNGETPNARKIADEVARVIIDQFNSNLR